MSPHYLVPAQTIRDELEIKKSRFITYLARASDKAEAQAFIRKIQQKYPDATHHCTAYIAGAPQGGAAIAADDDGEPSGTAGKPMLNVLLHKGIGEIVAVVVRYYGGIQLGAGGLVRAYSGAVQNACEKLPLSELIIYEYGDLTCDYAEEQGVRHHLQKLGVEIVACDYQQQVQLRIRTPNDLMTSINHQLGDLSRGKIQIRWDKDHTEAP